MTFVSRRAGAALAGAVLLSLARSGLAAPAAVDDIRDIRPLIAIPPWWRGLPLAAAIALAFCALVVGYRAYRRRKAQPLTPEARAHAALDEAEVLARAGRCREWAELVALTLRSALTARVGADVCPQTTSELASLDWSSRPEAAGIDMEQLLDLLWTCDLTRFALGRLDQQSLLASTQAARAWVTRSFSERKVTAPALGAEVAS